MRTRIHTQRLPVFALVAAAVALLVGLLDESSAFAPYPGGNGKIAYESAVEGNFEIFVMDADGSGQANVSNDPNVGRTIAIRPGLRTGRRSPSRGRARVT